MSRSSRPAAGMRSAGALPQGTPPAGPARGGYGSFTQESPEFRHESAEPLSTSE